MSKDNIEHYWPNPLESFTNGVQMDLRVRLACEFLKGSSNLPILPADQLAGYALDLATELLRVGSERGLVKPMPEDGDINAAFKRHIERNTEAGMYAQVCQRRAIAEDAKMQALQAPVTMPPQMPPGGRA